MSKELVCMTLHHFGIGGCELQLLSLAQALQKRNVDVIILSRDKEISAYPLDKTLMVFFIPFFFYKFRLIPLYLSFLFRWKIKRLPTVFHCHGICHFTEQILWFSQNKKIPAVLKIPEEKHIFSLKRKIDNRLNFFCTAQAILRKSSKGERRSLLENLFIGKNRKKTYANVHKYISLNSNIEEELKCININKEQVFSISNGIDPHRFIPVSEEEKKSLKKNFGLPRNFVISQPFPVLLNRRESKILLKRGQKLNNIFQIIAFF